MRALTLACSKLHPLTGRNWRAPARGMSTPTTSGIQTSAAGEAFIPASKRADGSLRKEIKVRPGYKPPEDVERYKSRSAETWRARSGGVPGADSTSSQTSETEVKSKNAKRREAARRKREVDSPQNQAVEAMESEVAKLRIGENGKIDAVSADVASGLTRPGADAHDAEVERQKKIRNHLKKLKAVRDLKIKKFAGEKLSAEQLVKIGKEQDIIGDLAKLKYDGPELENLAQLQSAEQGPD